MNGFIDARLALRRLIGAPGYTSAVILTLALAIGASVAVFSAVDAVLLKPLPIAEPGRVVIGWGTSPERNLPVVELPYRGIEYVAAHTRALAQVAAVAATSWSVVLDTPDRRTRLASTGVSTTFFDTLGVAPALGRTFRPDDDRDTAVGAAIVSHRLWVTRFGADPKVIGSTIRLPKPHTIVGVAPEGFDFPPGTDVWTPAVPVLLESSARFRIDALSDVGVLYLVGRLRDGTSIDAARAELTTFAAQLRQTSGASFGTGVRLLPIVEYVLGPVHRALWVIFAAVLLVLLVAAANVSALIVNRVSHRSGELTTRLALGATRADLVRPWIVEAALLCGVGGMAGLLASTIVSRVLIAFGSDQVPGLKTMVTSVSVLAFALIVTVGTALTSAIAPLRLAWGADRHAARSRESVRAAASGESQRLRTALVVLQIALSVVLLVGSLLVLRSFANLRRIELGFVPDDVIAMRVEMPGGVDATHEWLANLPSAVGSLHDVQAVGAVSQRPLSGPIGDDSWVILEGQPNTPAARRQNPIVNHLAATPGYFEALRIPLERGRLFTADDRVDAPLVALVSARTARQLWPHDDPIGKRLLMAASDARGPVWRTVVGVVGDVRYRGLADARLDVYDAALQSSNLAYDIMVRASSDPRALAGAIQAEILRRAPRALIDGVAPMRGVADATTAPWRFSGFVLTCFAAVAFCVAIVGVTGLVALDVTSRRRELAIRQALGAPRSRVLRAIAVRIAWRAALGLVLGLAIAASSTWLMRSLLFDVRALDPIAFGAVAALVVVVVSVACYVPARRGTALALVDVLRCD